jgi:hypothetical protein
VIDDAGIRDTLLPVGTIGWPEVTGASVRRQTAEAIRRRVL